MAQIDFDALNLQWQQENIAAEDKCNAEISSIPDNMISDSDSDYGPDDYQDPKHAPSVDPLTYSEVAALLTRIEDLVIKFIRINQIPIVYTKTAPGDVFELQEDLTLDQPCTFKSSVKSTITGNYIDLLHNKLIAEKLNIIRKQYLERYKTTLQDYHIMFYFAFLAFSYTMEVRSLYPTLKLLNLFIKVHQDIYRDLKPHKYYNIVCFIHARFVFSETQSDLLFNIFNSWLVSYGSFLVCDEKLYRQASHSRNRFFVRSKPCNWGLWFMEASVRTIRNNIFLAHSRLKKSPGKKCAKNGKNSKPSIPVTMHVNYFSQLLRHKCASCKTILVFDSYYASTASINTLVTKEIPFLVSIKTGSIPKFTEEDITLDTIKQFNQDKDEEMVSFHDSRKSITLTPGYYLRKNKKKFAASCTNAFKVARSGSNNAKFKPSHVYEMYSEHFNYCDRFNHRLHYLESNLENYLISKENIEIKTITNYSIKSIFQNLYAVYDTLCPETERMEMATYMERLAEEMVQIYVEKRNDFKQGVC